MFECQKRFEASVFSSVSSVCIHIDEETQMELSKNVCGIFKYFQRIYSHYYTC